MISWKSLQALLVLTVLAGESVASHNHVRHAHSRLANPERRMVRRGSCKPPSSSSSSASSSSAVPSTTASSTTTTSTSSTPTTTSTSSTHTTTSTTSTTSTHHTTSTTSTKQAAPTDSGSQISAVSQAAQGATPWGKKAGTSSGDFLSTLMPHLGWWYDWTPNPQQSGSALAVPMLWGLGSADGTDSARLQAFTRLTKAPEYLIGFEEPDCPAGGGSAGFDVGAGVSGWEQHIAPFKSKGTKLISPSMCHQVAETWLKQFSQQISTPWDYTNVHINKNNMAGVKADLDHYYNTYGNKPLWITEFACVDDSTGFTPCTDQGQINQFINDIVDLFESDGRVAAYAYSNGEGLGSVWPMTSPSGGFSQSGQTYLNAIKKYA